MEGQQTRTTTQKEQDGKQYRGSQKMVVRSYLSLRLPVQIGKSNRSRQSNFIDGLVLRLLTRRLP